MMSNKHRTDAALFVEQTLLDMKRMKAELDEHRYRLEQNIERRTEQLLKRIALLESCNATLSNKLALAQKELAALKQQTAQASPGEAEPNDRPVRLYVMNNQAQKPVGQNAQDKWDGHATAA